MQAPCPNTERAARELWLKSFPLGDKALQVQSRHECLVSRVARLGVWWNIGKRRPVRLPNIDERQYAQRHSLPIPCA